MSRPASVLMSVTPPPRPADSFRVVMGRPGEDAVEFAVVEPVLGGRSPSARWPPAPAPPKMSNFGQFSSDLGHLGKRPGTVGHVVTREHGGELRYTSAPERREEILRR